MKVRLATTPNAISCYRTVAPVHLIIDGEGATLCGKIPSEVWEISEPFDPERITLVKGTGCVKCVGAASRVLVE